MSEFQLIESTLRQAGQRRRWQRGWRGFWRGLLVGSLLWLVALIAYKLLPLPMLTLGVAGLIGLALLPVGFVIGWWRRESPLETAHWLDETEQLKERVSTAMEWSRTEPEATWRQLLVTDAAQHLTRLDVRRLLPYHLPQATRWTLLALALAAGLGFVPEYRSTAFRKQQKEAAVIREAGQHLADLSKHALERHAPALEETHRLVQSVAELGGKLARNPGQRKDALRQVAKLTQKIQKREQSLSRKPALRKMAEAARSGDQNTPGSAEQLQKQLAALQKAMGNQADHAQGLKQLQRQLAKLQQAAQNMLGQPSQSDAQARADLAQGLSDLARQSSELGASLPSLEKAIAALKANQIDQVLKNMQVADQNLEKLLQMAQAMQQLQQQAAQIGKTLAQQLQKGQAEAAINTLQKMVKQLKAGNLSKAQLQQMMQQVAKAVDPASQYGKTAQFLQQAVKQMQQGQKPGAAQSLTKAANELQNLLQQMADAQALQASLDALQKAQFCIGNGMGWGECQGHGFNPVPGQKPGRGVGTWGDDSQQLTPNQQQPMDNSGIQRPDMTPRGLSDRGKGNLSKNMAPTRIRGQFNPGAPMPSITLHGVSIKGQSTVAIHAAVTSAQSDAQAALSQEQVPRAYQGAVKDYFNDLK